MTPPLSNAPRVPRIEIGGRALSLVDVVALAQGKAVPRLAGEAAQRMQASFEVVASRLGDGDRIWAGPIGSLGDPNGFWEPIDASVTLTGSPSAFYATLAQINFIGIEHVPEPTTAILFAGGVLALGLSRRARTRREWHA